MGLGKPLISKQLCLIAHRMQGESWGEWLDIRPGKRVTLGRIGLTNWESSQKWGCGLLKKNADVSKWETHTKTTVKPKTKWGIHPLIA